MKKAEVEERENARERRGWMDGVLKANIRSVRSKSAALYSTRARLNVRIQWSA